MKENIIYLFLLPLLFLALSGIVFNLSGDYNGVTGFITAEKDYRIAACPTFHYKLEELEKNGFEVVRTDSTADNIRKLSEKTIDAFISGRALRPGEPDFRSEVVGEGFSFIFSERIDVTVEQLNYVDVVFYTDQDPGKVIETFGFVEEENIEVTDSVYEKLDEGIVITSVENTDYSSSGMVNVYNEDGKRVRQSRTPVLYFREDAKEVKEVF